MHVLKQKHISKQMKKIKKLIFFRKNYVLLLRYCKGNFASILNRMRGKGKFASFFLPSRRPRCTMRKHTITFNFKERKI